jgi:NAD(P)-dependent dehydrogenase (short-subunit alcohol dehydrogenase family)
MRRPSKANVSNPADLDRLYDQIRTEAGRIDVVFANAGAGALAPLGGLTEEDVDYELNVNVKGVIWTVQKAPPLMGPGGIVTSALFTCQTRPASVGSDEQNQ